MSCVTEESDTDFGLCSRAYLKIVFLALADSASDKNATNLCVILLEALQSRNKVWHDATPGRLLGAYHSTSTVIRIAGEVHYASLRGSQVYLHEYSQSMSWIWEHLI